VPHEQKIVYSKLVRDRIPEIITANGQTTRVRVLDDQDLLPALIAKLHEEAEEVVSAEPRTVIVTWIERTYHRRRRRSLTG